MSDLIHRAKEVLLVLADASFPKSEQIERAMQCFSGLMLSDLDDDIREELTCNLAGLMAVTEAYDFQEHESLGRMEDGDLDKCWHLLHLTSQDAIDAECERLIDELDRATKTLPVATIMSIRQHRDLMIPWLVGAISDAAAELSVDHQAEIGNASFFAIFLLSEFDALAALQTILDAIQIPGEAPFELFGDVITERLPEILAQLARPSLDCLMPVIQNRQANEFVRSAAIGAHYYALLSQIIGRKDVLDRMRWLLQQAFQNHDSELATGVVCCLSDIGPKELLEEIKFAYKSQLVDTSVISLRSIVADSERSSPELLDWIDHNRRPGVSDCLKELSGWAAFQPAPQPKAVVRVERLSSPPEIARQNPRVSTSGKLARIDHPGRNDPCPCGSHKKYKKCCGK